MRGTSLVQTYSSKKDSSAVEASTHSGSICLNLEDAYSISKCPEIILYVDRYIHLCKDASINAKENCFYLHRGRKMFLPRSLIKLVKAVGDDLSSSSTVHFSQTITFSSMSKNMPIGYYSCLAANHMVYISYVALQVFGPALLHLRKVRREGTTCSTCLKLEVCKWYQMSWAVCRRC